VVQIAPDHSALACERGAAVENPKVVKHHHRALCELVVQFHCRRSQDLVEGVKGLQYKQRFRLEEKKERNKKKKHNKKFTL